MSDTQNNEDLAKKLEEIGKKAKAAFGDLDFLDDLPSAPKRVELPFPYGSESARPYGWFCK